MDFDLARAIEEGPFVDLYEKIAGGLRLNAEDGLRLLNCPDLHTIGYLANLACERRHGRRVTYVRNMHLNYTNICRNSCAFCSFYRGDEEGYVLSMDEVAARLRRNAGQPLSEVHVVGGINFNLPYSYYLELLDTIGKVRPEAVIKAFTMVELDWIWRVSGKTLEEVLEELKAHGLKMAPGGGAEVFSERLHGLYFPNKLGADAWLRMARACHEAGIRTNATLLYGHHETLEERVFHLLRLRELQDETEGFEAFIPLSFQTENNLLSNLPGPGALDDLKMIAVSRLLLDNFPHIKAYWVMLGPKLAQVGLLYGADDLDGTVVEEHISHEAGASSPQALTVEELRRLIEEAGRIPMERDGYYQEIEKSNA